MSWADNEQSLIAHFDTAWSDTPIAWPNVEFEPDSDPAAANEPFVRFQINPTQNDFASIGSSDGKAHYRETGDIFITVLVPQGKGKKQANTLATQVAVLMRNKRIGNYLTRAATKLPDSLEKGWFVVPVQIPYQLDTFEAEL